MILTDKQQRHIELIKNILTNCDMNKFVLKGGTSLLLHYGLDRYSEDIDLDAITFDANLLSSIKDYLNKCNIAYRIRKDTNTVFRIMIDYNDYNYPLKIEVSFRNVEKINSGYYKDNIINVGNYNIYSKELIVKQKCLAFQQRDKIRDFYDIIFLLRNNRELFSDSDIINIRDKIKYTNIDSLEQELLFDMESRNVYKIDITDFIINSIELVEQEYIKVLSNKKTSYYIDSDNLLVTVGDKVLITQNNDIVRRTLDMMINSNSNDDLIISYINMVNKGNKLI